MRDEAAQCEALSRLDKPSGLRATFTTTPFSAANGRSSVIDDADIASDFFAHSGLDAARRRIESLGTGDIEFQLALIAGVTAAKGRRAHRGQRDPSVRHLAVGALSAQERIEAATAVGHLLVSTSLTDGGGNVEWLGIDSAADLEGSCYGPLGSTLYSGRAGIAIFLATSRALNRTNRLASTARRPPPHAPIS